MIKLQKKNIDLQKENNRMVKSSIEKQINELENCKAKLNNYLQDLAKKSQQMVSQFSEIIRKVCSEKSKYLESSQNKDIYELRDELIRRKNELEVRKKYITNFLNFLEGKSKCINPEGIIAQIIPFIQVDAFFNENIVFVTEILSTIDIDKKYHSTETTVTKEGSQNQFSLSEIRSYNDVTVKQFTLEKDLRENQYPY